MGIDEFGIKDHLTKKLKIIFIGFNPSTRSGEIGHHYAGRGNKFWRLLFDAGFTPYLLKPEEDQKITQWGIGLTNIVARPTPKASDLTNEEYRQGAVILREKITEYKPQIAAFVGKGVYQKYSGKSQVPWGLQKESIVKGVLDYVCPSSSGLVRMPYEEILEVYKGLKALSAE